MFTLSGSGKAVYRFPVFCRFEGPLHITIILNALLFFALCPSPDAWDGSESHGDICIEGIREKARENVDLWNKG